ncbi:MAG: 16S rRNA (cytosine(967)-C(5))-methyltransferase RsmB [Betaproteobacteria bacterium]
MIAAQRAAAQRVSVVLAGGSLAHHHPASDEELGSQDRAAALDLTQGTLRHLGRLRALVGLMVQRPIPDPAVEALVLVALYQLWNTRAAPHAIVDHAVRAVRALRATGASGLVNALLRRFLRERAPLLDRAATTPEGRWSHPGWWIGKLEAQYGVHAAAILQSGLEHPPMSVRVNLRRVSVEAYLARVASEGIAVRRLANDALLMERPMAAARLPGFADGHVSIQDAGAQWAARLLDAADGQRVLDACAAPGGKAAHILERAAVDLLALDRDAGRLEEVGRTLGRLGLRARRVAADAADLASWWDGVPFDRVLLDAPCSASGIVRRHPDAKWLRRASDIPAFAQTQGRLLDALWQVLVPGGTLLYATCSVFAEENAATIDAFLERHADVHRPDFDALPGTGGQLLPDQEHDGFFYAPLRKSHR